LLENLLFVSFQKEYLKGYKMSKKESRNAFFCQVTVIDHFSSFFILFHPFSSKKAEKGRKRQKKAGTGKKRDQRWIIKKRNLKQIMKK